MVFIGCAVDAQPVEGPPTVESPPAQTPAQSATAPALPPAGIIPANISLDGTGAPVADATFLYPLIRDALDRRIRPTLRFGASITYGPIVPWPLIPLVIGARTAVNVTVTIAGDDASNVVSGITTVTLNSAVVPPATPAVLFLSDDPEYLTSEGLIFHGNVNAGRPARLYYYHSDIGLPRDLDVILTATTVASRVQLIQSEGGPDLDVMSVGHTVTRDYLQFQHANEGTVIDLVPGTPFVVRHALILQNELIAGAVDVTVVGGGAVTVSVVASSGDTRPERYLGGPRVAFDGHRRHGSFDLGNYGTVVAAFTAGGPPVAAKYGGRTPTPSNLDAGDDGHDYGDYGVVRRMTFTLDNPTADPHRVYLYEKPLGGSVRSTFVVDGQFKEVDCVRLPRAYGVMTYQLPPHSTGATTTETMTDGGSSYPLEFGVTEDQPFPYAPPVGAPDGCSPSAPSAQ
ncbi:MAG: hypothetical protein IAI50_13640 [Candidatus Eremiobacteraeota bacterium]|nr:hypothetical protein [Candidatus Eremiobacteraeota bacterium]